jgi:hypothetical protein
LLGIEMRSSFISANPEPMTHDRPTRFLFFGGTDNQLPQASN